MTAISELFNADFEEDSVAEVGLLLLSCVFCFYIPMYTMLVDINSFWPVLGAGRPHTIRIF